MVALQGHLMLTMLKAALTSLGLHENVEESVQQGWLFLMVTICEQAG